MTETVAADSPDRLASMVGALEEEIVLGWLQPRERLVEEAIAERFAAKRHIVREAIFELERMGLVERQPNKGAVVRVLDPEEVSDIYEVRIALETLAAQRIPLPPPPEVLADLHATQALHDRAVAAQDPRSAFRANMRFHSVFFAACGNPHLAMMIRLSARKVHGARSLTAVNPTYLERARSEHRAIIAALETSDRDTLVALCRSHILPSRDICIQTATLRRRLDRPTPDMAAAQKD